MLLPLVQASMLLLLAPLLLQFRLLLLLRLGLIHDHRSCRQPFGLLLLLLLLLLLQHHVLQLGQLA